MSMMTKFFEKIQLYNNNGAFDSFNASVFYIFNASLSLFSTLLFNDDQVNGIGVLTMNLINYWYDHTIVMNIRRQCDSMWLKEFTVNTDKIGFPTIFFAPFLSFKLPGVFFYSSAAQNLYARVPFFFVNEFLAHGMNGHLILVYFIFGVNLLRLISTITCMCGCRCTEFVLYFSISLDSCWCVTRVHIEI